MKSEDLKDLLEGVAQGAGASRPQPAHARTKANEAALIARKPITFRERPTGARDGQR